MEALTEMQVVKRNGQVEPMSFDKILNRMWLVGQHLHLNYQHIAIKVIEQLYNNIHTSKIDELIAEQCAYMSSQHLDYATLASRMIASNHQKNTPTTFTEAMSQIPLLNQEFVSFVNEHSALLDAMVCHERDFLIDYFGFKTLERSYLLKSAEGKLMERPQYMWLRVSIGIHLHGKNALDKIKETYDLMSTKHFTHATPTLFNAGTNKQQLSSCYLIAMEDDSIDGIFNTLKECALISKYSGGIGLHIHNIRSKGSTIKGTNGVTDGIVPMLRVFNNTARYVNQCGKRNGSIAIYLEAWHPDVFDFLEMRKNHGDEELKARDLFYALWISDLFMERVKLNGTWSLFCPNKCADLIELWGTEFKQRFEQYEQEGKAMKTIKARDLWFAILDAQMETGTPFMVYKDACNAKSNQQNLGTIKSSNLCTEIIQFSSPSETAVCNLASIALPMFVNESTKTFDFDKLHQVTKVVTANLNKVIDVNFYPTDKTKISNLKHRPMGIGVQGLADTFLLMDIAYQSDEARKLNKDIFETMYHAALEQSNQLAMEEGTYDSFHGSPASRGVLQFDMWGVTPSNRYDWNALKQSIQDIGLRNSLLIAPMPTASTSQILGFNECFEPFTSNLYTRRTLAGEFVVVNKYLMKELDQLGLWNEQIKNNIIANKGSIQQLTMLPEHVKNKYKIVWEIPMKHLIDMAAERGAFICQSQSLNLWMEDPVYNKLTSMHFYAWEKGLKTGIYYLRRKAKHQAQQFTIEPERLVQVGETETEEECTMCSA